MTMGGAKKRFYGVVEKRQKNGILVDLYFRHRDGVNKSGNRVREHDGIIVKITWFKDPSKSAWYYNNIARKENNPRFREFIDSED
jgi:hypothetical protein